MAFSDPLSVTIGADTISLPRTGSGIDAGVYTSADGYTQVKVNHQSARANRFRRQFRLDHSKVAADPFVSTINARYLETVYIVLDVPAVGFTATEELDLYKGMATMLSASTYALATKFIGGES